MTRSNLVGGEMLNWSDLHPADSRPAVSGPAATAVLAAALKPGDTVLIAGPHSHSLYADLAAKAESIDILVRSAPDAEELAESLTHAKTQVYCGSLDRFETDETYDLIVALDGLERLVGPDTESLPWTDALAKLVNCLSPHGRMLLGATNTFSVNRLIQPDITAALPRDEDWGRAVADTAPAGLTPLETALRAVGVKVEERQSAPKVESPTSVVSDAGAGAGVSGAGADAGVSGAGADAGVSGAGADAGVSGAGADAGVSGADADAGVSGADADAGVSGADASAEGAGLSGLRAGVLSARIHGLYPSLVEAEILVGDNAQLTGARAARVVAGRNGGPALMDPYRVVMDAARAGLLVELAPAWYVVVGVELPVESVDGELVEERLLAALRVDDQLALRREITAYVEWLRTTSTAGAADNVIVDGTSYRLFGEGSGGTVEEQLERFVRRALESGSRQPWPAGGGVEELTARLASMVGITLAPATTRDVIRPLGSAEQLSTVARLADELAHASARAILFEGTASGIRRSVPYRLGHAMLNPARVVRRRLKRVLRRR
ncbi:hypothetical protein [Kribbella yunnanensis]|uniref:hypothetical protein n=1 Tax=Kribbella yunnanensis TaxID=190194 RepID=UPI0031E0D55E